MVKRITIIEDNHATCSQIKDWFSDSLNYNVVGVFYNGIDAVKKLEPNPSDIYIIDMRLPLLNGFETMLLLRQKGYHGVMLGVSHAYYKTERLLAVQAGANGYSQLKKEAIFSALNAIQHNELPFNDNYYQKWEQDTLQFKLYEKDEDARNQLLNPQFKKILLLTYQGYNTAQIADTMQLKKHTVEQYRANMLQQLGFVNICQAVAWAIFGNVIITSELPPPPGNYQL